MEQSQNGNCCNDSVAITYQKNDNNNTTKSVLAENKQDAKNIQIWKTDDGEEIDLNGKKYKVIKKKKKGE